MKKLLRYGALLFFAGITTLAYAQQDWPIELSSAKAKVEIYQPQPETFKDNKLTGRAAVSVTVHGKTAPTFGAFWFSATLATDLDKRTFDLQHVDVTKIKFSQATPDEEKEFDAILQKALSNNALHGSLDSLLATLADVQKQQQVAEKLQTNPPKIIFLKYPAVLVYLDGTPKLQAIDGSKLMRVVNTPMLMLFDPASKQYYLSSGSVWYKATDVDGPWQIDQNPPQEIASIVTNNGKPVKNTVADAQMPRIIVATEPTELIISEGEPQYAPIQGTGLLYMSNTENDVFMAIDSQSYYILISGRWYTSKSLEGPWIYTAPNKLPIDFAKIPSNSPKANVLVSIAGTVQAQDALIAAQIPQTAAVKRSSAKLTVTYDGAPKFVPINGTSLEYAINTATPVLLVNGKYYACDSAVWFVAPSPNGPWAVADAIPQEIQGIPPDCPIYNVKYVYVYDSTPDVVYVGYTPAYLGWYPYYGTVVYGTGFIYPAWYGTYYYPAPVTFGFGVHYNSFTDSWTVGFRWSSGFNSIGFIWNSGWNNHGWYGPWRPIGPYHWGPGPYIHHPVYVNRNVINIGNNINIGNHNFRIDANVRNNLYNLHTNSERVAYDLHPTRQKASGASRISVAKNKANNIITDSNGNIYRHNKDGWERNNGYKWERAQTSQIHTKESGIQRDRIANKIAQRPNVVPHQVVRDYQARQHGESLARRTTAPAVRDFGQMRGVGASSIRSLRR